MERDIVNGITAVPPVPDPELVATLASAISEGSAAPVEPAEAEDAAFEFEYV
jgi:hypothetical protein